MIVVQIHHDRGTQVVECHDETEARRVIACDLRDCDVQRVTCGELGFDQTVDNRRKVCFN